MSTYLSDLRHRKSRI